MPSYLSADVYIEELERLSPPGVELDRFDVTYLHKSVVRDVRSVWTYDTAVTAFIGYTQKAQNQQGESLHGKPVLVTSWGQYVRMFGEFFNGYYLPDAIYGFFLNGGTQAYIVSIKSEAHQTTRPITLSDYQGRHELNTGLAGLERIGAIDLIAAPDVWSAFQAGEIDMRGVRGIHQSLINFCEIVHTTFAILDCPPSLMPQEIKEWRLNMNYDSSRAALYYPWVEIANPTDSGRTRLIPPSEHIARVYARHDMSDGIHTTPSNEVMRGILGLELHTIKTEEDILNPLGINVFRFLPSRGIRVWGSRTLSSYVGFRFIRVRRLLNYIQQTLYRGTQWVIFKQYSPALQLEVRNEIGLFMHTLWRAGALYGTHPHEAYIVTASGQKNPTGIIIVEVDVTVAEGQYHTFRIVYNLNS